jgi:transketolase
MNMAAFYNRQVGGKIRRDIITMSYQAQVGHVASALSMVDYLGKLFEFGITPEQYRFVLGKPYGAQAYYSLFAHFGWIPASFSLFGSLDDQWRYIIQKEHKLITYIDESMGNCLSVACGISMANRPVFVNISDAAFQEGTIWESILFAGAHKLGNLIMAIDYNDMQALGRVSEILDLTNLSEKLIKFGWEVYPCNGHDLSSISEMLNDYAEKIHDKPVAFVFRTEKGKGISFMEGNTEWHYRTFDEGTYQMAMQELL